MRGQRLQRVDHRLQTLLDRFACGVNVNEVGERWFVIGGVLFFAASFFCGVDVDLSDTRRGFQFFSMSRYGATRLTTTVWPLD